MAGDDVGPDNPVADADFQPLQEELVTHPLPGFIEEADEPRWRRHVPYSIKRLARATSQWIKGPSVPKHYQIEPVLPQIQQFPIQLLDKLIPRRRYRVLLLALWLLLWAITIGLVKRHEGDTTYLEPYGTPQTIGCGASFWNRDDSCGINGDKCRPFTDQAWAFKCPANCRSYHLGEQRAVGRQEVNYQSLAIGGPVDDQDEHGAYRGDSWICASAIHSGIITNAEGGCGVVKVDGSRKYFNSTTRNGITTIDFDSYFPKTFIFKQGIECKAKDLRWGMLGVSATFSAFVSLFTTSPAVFFFTCFSGLFWHTGLVSDPPNHSSFRELFTIILGKYLPVMFVAWVMYDKMGVRRTLRGLGAQIEKTILWLGACWCGALDNYILSRAIPIQRLNGHDIQQQHGAKAALAIMILVVTFIIAQQVWYFRQEGRFIKYGKLYLVLLGGILLSLVLTPLDLHLRLHHYLFALLLLPGTSMQTRPALIYQGLLVGLFINGMARWGWDPILQTSFALRGDAAIGSVIPALASAPIISSNATSTSVLADNAVVPGISFSWESPPEDFYYRIDGISVLVNDVERFRGYFDADDSFVKREWTWTRRKGHEGENEYFRWAYMSATSSLDYSRAGTWNGDLGWEDPEPGASSIVGR